MKQQQFEQQHQNLWQRFAATLTALEQGGDVADLAEFSAQYRLICQQAALAQSRGYGELLATQLADMALRGHQQLYQRKDNFGERLLRFVLLEFPQLLRNEWRIVCASLLTFVLPLLLMGVLCFFRNELAYSVYDADTIANFEAMYSPSTKAIGRERESDTDLAMFGFYIRNNIGIGFQTFAGGIAFGVGSLFFLVYNGISIGTVGGYLAQFGYGETFFGFVIGHGAFELTAIVIAGAAGLKLGMALLAPGRKQRLRALADAARIAVQLMYGAALMLLVAAFIEAYWSSSAAIPATVKFAVGAALWTGVLLYFVAGGRRRAT
jgi:uncharacterized membrane protein SpoIIM required for sporulation